MSLIKLQGNASGTGALTIAAPNTNTDRTLTLPDTTGTIVMNEGSGIFKIDSSGNVGIGTTTPGVILHTSTGSATVTGRFESTSASNSSTIDFPNPVNTINKIRVGSFDDDFAVLTDGTERMRIDSSGNVGIGTASPATKLEIASDVMGDNFIRLNQNASSSTNFGVPVGKIQMNWIGDPNWASINFEDERGSGTGTHKSGISFTTRDGNDAGLERMRINNTGIVFVGKSGSNIAVAGWQFDPSGGGSLVGTISSGTNELFTFNNLSTTGTAQLDFRTANSEKGSISWNNTNTAFNTTSDYRLKENVAPMQNALDTVAQLNPVTYTWKADGSAGQGFIAHELQAVVPDCVTGEKDAVDAEGNPQYQGVDTSFLVATLVKAIQEQQSLITDLTARLTALEAN